MDNCEHVVDAVVPLAVALLRAAPALRILATSRERLRVNGEHLLRLQPLPPEAALQLFVERAQALDPHFALQGSFVLAATDMCGRLDGIPLAIELAVARLPHLGLLEIAAPTRSAVGASRCQSRHARPPSDHADHDLLEFQSPERTRA